jgi:hypothetical protein
VTAAPSWPRVLLRSEDSDHHLSVIETAPSPATAHLCTPTTSMRPSMSWRANLSSSFVTRTSQWARVN